MGQNAGGNLPDAYKDVSQKSQQIPLNYNTLGNVDMSRMGGMTSQFTPNAALNTAVDPAATTYLQTQGDQGQDFARAMTARNYPNSPLVKEAMGSNPGGVSTAPAPQAPATPAAPSPTKPGNEYNPGNGGYSDYSPYTQDPPSYYPANGGMSAQVMPYGSSQYGPDTGIAPPDPYSPYDPRMKTGTPINSSGVYNNPSSPVGSNSGLMNNLSDPARLQSNRFFGNNPSLTDPFQAHQNMASQIASFGAQAVPGAAAFQQGLFTPGFNAAENAFMNSEGERQSRLLNQQMAGLGNKFSGTPFHSGYLNMSREMGAEAASNLGQAAQNLAVNRQGLAAQAAQRILGSPTQATEQAQNVPSSLLQLITQLQQAPLQAGVSYLSNTPIMAPTIIPGTQYM